MLEVHYGSLVEFPFLQSAVWLFFSSFDWEWACHQPSCTIASPIRQWENAKLLNTSVLFFYSHILDLDLEIHCRNAEKNIIAFVLSLHHKHRHALNFACTDLENRVVSNIAISDGLTWLANDSYRSCGPALHLTRWWASRECRTNIAGHFLVWYQANAETALGGEGYGDQTSYHTILKVHSLSSLVFLCHQLPLVNEALSCAISLLFVRLETHMRFYHFGWVTSVVSPPSSIWLHCQNFHTTAFHPWVS